VSLHDVPQDRPEPVESGTQLKTQRPSQTPTSRQKPPVPAETAETAETADVRFEFRQLPSAAASMALEILFVVPPSGGNARRKPPEGGTAKRSRENDGASGCWLSVSHPRKGLATSIVKRNNRRNMQCPGGCWHRWMGSQFITASKLCRSVLPRNPSRPRWRNQSRSTSDWFSGCRTGRPVDGGAEVGGSGSLIAHVLDRLRTDREERRRRV
jgi:hypothetical protein